MDILAFKKFRAPVQNEVSAMSELLKILANAFGAVRAESSYMWYVELEDLRQFVDGNPDAQRFAVELSGVFSEMGAMDSKWQPFTDDLVKALMPPYEERAKAKRKTQ